MKFRRWPKIISEVKSDEQNRQKEQPANTVNGN